MGWAMNYPFSPRTWSRDEWMRWTELLPQWGIKKLFVWPGLEFVNFHDQGEWEAMIELCFKIIESAKKAGLDIILGRCLNGICEHQESDLFSRDARDLSFVDVGSDSFHEKIIAPLSRAFEALPSIDGWWCIDRDPGRSLGRSGADFAKAFYELHRGVCPQARAYYWMWAGFTERCDQAEGWRDVEQSFWTEAVKEAQNLFGEQLELIACWEGHFASIKGLEQRVSYFPYHFLEAEPSLPFSYVEGELNHQTPCRPSPLSQEVMLNLQTPCLRTPRLKAIQMKEGDQGTSFEDLEKLWCWSESSLRKTQVIWADLMKAIEAKALNEKLLTEWREHTGATFPIKRGHLYELSP